MKDPESIFYLENLKKCIDKKYYMCKCPRCGKELDDDHYDEVKEYHNFNAGVCGYCGYHSYYIYFF